MILFSQYPQHLQEIGVLLSHNSIAHVFVDGYALMMLALFSTFSFNYYCRCYSKSCYYYYHHYCCYCYYCYYCYYYCYYCYCYCYYCYYYCYYYYYNYYCYYYYICYYYYLLTNCTHRNLYRKLKALKSFKHEDSRVKVIMLSINKVR